MEGNNNNNGKWWLWFVIPIAALTTWNLFRNTSRSANRVTEDLNETNAQAAKLYDLFGVVKVGGFAVATPVVKTSTLQRIGWLARNIYDWAGVQRAFTILCGGGYTVLQAASTALSTDEYNAFQNLIQKALTQKRIFCGDVAYHTLYNPSNYGGQVGENFKANQYVGRCISTNDKYYGYISQSDGVQYAAERQFFVTD